MNKRICTVCGEQFPVESVAMLHCEEFKEWDDHPDDFLYLIVKDADGEPDWWKVPI